MDSEDLVFYINKHKKAYEERVKKEQKNCQNISHQEERQMNEEQSAVETDNIDPKEQIQTNKKNTCINSILHDQNEAKRRKQIETKLKEKNNSQSKENEKKTEAPKTVNQEEADYLYALKLSEQLNGILAEDSSNDPAIPKYNEDLNEQNIQEEICEKKQFIEDEVRKPDEIYTECLLGDNSIIQYHQSLRKYPHVINSLNQFYETNFRPNKKDTFEYKHEINECNKKKPADVKEMNKSEKGCINDIKTALLGKGTSINIERKINVSAEEKIKQKEGTSVSVSLSNICIDKDAFKKSVQKEKTKKENQNKMVDKHYKQAVNDKINAEKTYIQGTALNIIDLTMTPIKNKTQKEEATTKNKTYNASNINKTLTKPTNINEKKMNQEPNTNIVNDIKRDHMVKSYQERHHREKDYSNGIWYKSENECKYIQTFADPNANTSHKNKESKNPLHEITDEFSVYSKNASGKLIKEYINTVCLDKKNKFGQKEVVKVDDKKNEEEALRLYSRYRISNGIKENTKMESIYFVNATKCTPLQNKNYEKYVETAKTENNSCHVSGNSFVNKSNIQTHSKNSYNEINRNQIDKIYVKRDGDGNNKYIMKNIRYSNEMEQNNKNIRTIMFTNVTKPTQPKEGKEKITSNEKLVRKK